MRIELFDYDLPADLIAQEPAARRDESRLLTLARGVAGPPSEHRFTQIPQLLRAGDVLVVNDAKVDPLRLHGRRATGGVVEILLLHEAEAPAGARGSVWEAMVRGGRRLLDGEVLQLGADSGKVGGNVAAEGGAQDIGSGAEIIVRESLSGGRRLMELPPGREAHELIGRWGEMPLPPYIRRQPGDERAAIDRDRYQTVYAREHGAVAAPTAGLHFTRGLLRQIERAGVEIATLTLRVGPGTFQPLRVDEIAEHRMEAEPYVLPEHCVAAIMAAKERQGRVVGVGTTVVRTLEHAARANDGIEIAAGAGDADVFIYPGFEFRVIDAMLTNFHLPRSTPILMAAAFAGRERLLQAYEFAVRERFRFYSYGDAMLIT
ncbi:MAG: tRNA preQ1(34) S-adenosylmethionine ribosyltransferase-isomerase QueA [Acidobacteria bacterium]|nr:tRNA preQ1(34) S-adenosylmethionine ribosyltransferase-isomerase QueA [Acidobacteriota bacterium]